MSYKDLEQTIDFARNNLPIVNFPLGNFPMNYLTPTTAGVACKKKRAPEMGGQKENDMRGEFAVKAVLPTDQIQRDYALQRLYELRGNKIRPLQSQFGLRDDNAPQSFNELLDRLNSNKFVYPEDRRDTKNGVWGALDYIRWRDPSVKEDQVGYDAAIEKLEAAYQDARDAVVYADTKDLKSITDGFKSWTIQ